MHLFSSSHLLISTYCDASVSDVWCVWQADRGVEDVGALSEGVCPPCSGPGPAEALSEGRQLPALLE